MRPGTPDDDDRDQPETPDTPNTPAADLAGERVWLRGPDGRAGWYIRPAVAARRLGKSLRNVQFACQQYQTRISAERAAHAAGAGPAPHYAPRAHELQALQLGVGPNGEWWIREDALARHYVNRRVNPATGKRGPGWPAGRPRGPRRAAPRAEPPDAPSGPSGDDA